ncbi:MAG: hypothetical protein ACRCX4_13320 [Bacteroidales bacterium]
MERNTYFVVGIYVYRGKEIRISWQANTGIKLIASNAHKSKHLRD